MKKLSMFAVGVALAIGCGKKDPAAGLISGLEDWKNKMCACKDKACADKVHEDYKKWENDVMEPKLKEIGEKNLSKETMEKGDKLDDARKECRRKFADAEPAAAPAGGDPAAPAAPAGSAAPATP